MGPVDFFWLCTVFFKIWKQLLKMKGFHITQDFWFLLKTWQYGLTFLQGSEGRKLSVSSLFRRGVCSVCRGLHRSLLTPRY